MAEPTSYREIHIARQSARGTPVGLNTASAWVALPAIRDTSNLGAERNRIIPREMTPSRNVVRKSLRGTNVGRPTMQMGIYYDLLGIWLTAFFGDPTTTAAAGGGSGKNQHVWKSGGSTLPYYTIRSYDGLNWWQSQDCRCNELVFTGTGGNELALVTSNWIGSVPTKLATAPNAVPFVDDADYIQPADVPQPLARLNDVIYADLMSINMNLTNNLAPRYTMQRSTTFRRTSIGSFGGTFDLTADYLTYGVDTTVVGTVTAGAGVVVTPATMVGIEEGSVGYAVNADGTAGEWVLVESITGSTFTADFAQNKAANWLFDIYSFKRLFAEGGYPGEIEVEYSDTNVTIGTGGSATNPVARFEIENPLIETGPDEEQDESPIQHVTGQMGYLASPASSFTATLINELAAAFYTTGYA